MPVVLLGHSMGGRTAFALAGEPGVVGVVGLAPWVEDSDRVGPVAGRRIDVLHGSVDRMTDPQASRAWVEQAGRRGAVVSYTAVPAAGHTMLGRPWFWHRRAAAAVVADLRPVGAGTAGHRDTGYPVVPPIALSTRQDDLLPEPTPTGRQS